MTANHTQAVEAAAKINASLDSFFSLHVDPEPKALAQLRRIQEAVSALTLPQEVAAEVELMAAVDKVLSEFGTSSDGLYDLYQARNAIEAAASPTVHAQRGGKYDIAIAVVPANPATEQGRAVDEGAAK